MNVVSASLNCPTLIIYQCPTLAKYENSSTMTMSLVISLAFSFILLLILTKTLFSLIRNVTNVTNVPSLCSEPPDLAAAAPKASLVQGKSLSLQTWTLNKYIYILGSCQSTKNSTPLGANTPTSTNGKKWMII